MSAITMLFYGMLALPLIGAILNGLIVRTPNKNLSHLLGCTVMAGAFLCAVGLYLLYLDQGNPTLIIPGMTWLEAGGFSAPFRFILDQLSGLMMLIITGIGTLIHIYAGGYMHEESRTWRFFAYLNLFVFMMLLLVMGDNMLIMFIGWEGVGLCSYLLIGYWYEKDANAAAGMKAFLVNRIGDIGFLIGIFLTYKYFGTVSFSELRLFIFEGPGLTPELLDAIGWITLALFIGATGKSAQIPLYIWLPDAMAGPTPVSALIHAATMVTAGIYMMTRLSFLYYLAPSTQTVVMVIGALTAFFAATIAIVQTDIKKVLAYSTVSQLGYMVLACGVGAYSAGVFHLFTHACFKALLFLGAGSVIVAMHHEQDMRVMGGLRKYMPFTHGAMLIGVLAIIGMPPFSGFFSKDEILWKSYTAGGPLLWGIGAATALCTAFYMVRLLMMTFYGPNRSDEPTRSHLRETSPLMYVPLLILALLSATVGFLNVPHIIPFPAHLAFHHYLEPITAIPDLVSERWAFLNASYAHSLEWTLMGLSTAGMLLAALLAVLLYGRGISTSATKMKERLAVPHHLLTNKYYIDEFYDRNIVSPLKEMSTFLWRIIDVKIVDGLVNGIGQACALVGGLISFRSSGSLHRHGMVLMVGVVCLMAMLLFI